MSKSHKPTMRLHSAPIGSVVTLPSMRHHKSMYVGDVDTEGYAYLWACKGAKEDGMRWLVMAAGSHEVALS